MPPASPAQPEGAPSPPTTPAPLVRGARVLVVEDEEHLADGLRFNLAGAGFRVSVVTTAEAARAALEEQSFDLVILDVMLPDGDGLGVCRWMRDRADYTPILVLTARSLTEDMLVGLESGADDYMTKPFDLRELLARVSGILRRQRWLSREPERPLIEFAGNRIDLKTFRADARGRAVELSYKEAMLVKLFAERPGEVLSRAEILEKVWGLKGHLKSRTVDNFILRLRRYFEDDPENPKHILSVRGAGYRFVP